MIDTSTDHGPPALPFVPTDDDLPAGMRVEHGKVVPHLTVEERIARGRSARREVPRSSHADYSPSPHRVDPVVLLEQQATTRVPELVPIRYGRMLQTPFTFYRGAALVMAADLANTPRSGIVTQACGDAHLMNFGVFATPERRLAFGINDFDETLPGPWEWDVKRLAASMVVASRNNEFTAAECRQVAQATVAAYRTAIRELAEMPNLAVWYAHVDVESALSRLDGEVDRKVIKRLAANIAKSRTRDHLQAFSKLTKIVDGEPRFVSDPPLVQPIGDILTDVHPDDIEQGLRRIVRSYRRTLQSDRRHLLEEYRVVDMARKVVGVGSVGTRAWILLLLGRDNDDPLLLQAKEAQPSVLESYAGSSTHATSGERVVHGQHLMQAASDIFLGWDRVVGVDGVPRDFYLRQLRDWKGAAEVEALSPAGMGFYGTACARALARAHARSGDRIAVAAYLGSSDSFDRAVASFAEAYADQTERDFEALKAAESDGRITVVHDV
jgi:ribosomal protein S20